MSTTIFEKQGTVLTVKPQGRLDAATAPILEKELWPYLSDVQDITMDFTDIEYISSGGLRVLLATEQVLEDRGGSMRLIHVNEYIMEIFELVGFMDIVKVEES
jgi:anti-sigma B factor antagonist